MILELLFVAASVGAILMVNGGGPKRRLYGSTLGLASQGYWINIAGQIDKWELWAAVGAYTVSWAWGAWKAWSDLRKQRARRWTIKISEQLPFPSWEN